ncbi:class III lanthipeptide [Paucisalibacillus globulus]|nr:class III lanthipeptide [Paucisalibacillus globulus]
MNNMEKVLKLQKMEQSFFGGLTSNLSFVCKKESTLSLFLCVPEN